MSTEKKKNIFVKNNSQYHLTCTALQPNKVKTDSGKEITVNKKLFTVTFESKTVDPMTGKIIATGYTSISEDQFDKLASSCRIFSNAVKSGKLVKYKEAPKEALMDSQLIDGLSEENEALKARVAELEAQLVEGERSSAKKPKEDKKAKEEDLEF